MDTWYQMWDKTYQCQISDAGGWFIGVRFSMFHDFSMIFDDFSKFRDFPWLFQKILFFQFFQTLWEPCNRPHEVAKALVMAWQQTTVTTWTNNNLSLIMPF